MTERPERLDATVKTFVNRLASDLARPAFSAIAARLRARAQSLAAQGLDSEQIIATITREEMGRPSNRAAPMSARTLGAVIRIADQADRQTGKVQ